MCFSSFILWKPFLPMTIPWKLKFDEARCLFFDILRSIIAHWYEIQFCTLSAAPALLMTLKVQGVEFTSFACLFFSSWTQTHHPWTITYWMELHSKIKPSDLVGFFRRVWWRRSEVKLRIRTRRRSNRRPKMAKKSQVTMTRQILCHWCQASRLWGCRMVLNSTWRSRFFLRQDTYELI